MDGFQIPLRLCSSEVEVQVKSAGGVTPQAFRMWISVIIEGEAYQKLISHCL